MVSPPSATRLPKQTSNANAPIGSISADVTGMLQDSKGQPIRGTLNADVYLTPAFRFSFGNIIGPTGVTAVGDLATWGDASGRFLVDTSPAALTPKLALFTPSVAGIVPASGGGASKFLRADATWDLLAYSTAGLGVGGAVTQLTSRTTGVTLNKICGQITMFSAAGATAAATFTVTNSLVAATDTIVLNQQSGTNLYNFLVTAVTAGSFNVTFFTTGGVATDAPVINFLVLKAVAS